MLQFFLSIFYFILFFSVYLARRKDVGLWQLMGTLRPNLLLRREGNCEQILSMRLKVIFII